MQETEQPRGCSLLSILYCRLFRENSDALLLLEGGTVFPWDETYQLPHDNMAKLQ